MKKKGYGRQIFISQTRNYNHPQNLLGLSSFRQSWLFAEV